MLNKNKCINYNLIENEFFIDSKNSNYFVKNKTDDWFNDVFKDISLAIGKKGRPPKYCGT
jgi:hypothetical protein